MFAFSNTCWHASKLRRFNNKGGHRPLTGTLYIPQLISEGNVYEIFFRKISGLTKYYALLNSFGCGSNVSVRNCDAGSIIHARSNSVDYIFTDPPFGSNIFYADCNFLAEAWLGKTTDTRAEAVVNRSLKRENGGKSLAAYEGLLEAAFGEMARVLKRGKRADVVFNNTDGETWSSVQRAFTKAGLSISGTAALNKVQMSVKGYKSASASENVATTDIVLGLVNKKSKSIVYLATTKKRHEDLIPRLFKRYLNSPEFTQDERFVIPDFFSFYLRHCYENKINVSGVSLGSVRNILESTGSLSLLPRSANNLVTSPDAA